MGRNHGQEQQAPLTKYEKNDMISRVMPYFRGIALFFWQGPTVMVFHEYERSLFVIMDDGYPPVSILILIGFILLEAVFYGFGSAIQNVNEGKLEEEAAGGNKKAARLLEIVNRPVRFVHTIQVTTHLMGMIIGAAILPAMIGMVERRFLFGKVLAWVDPAQVMAAAGTPWYRNPSWWQWAGVLALVTVFVLVLVISFGIIIPKRLAAKEPEKWGYHMLPVVLFFAGVFLPLTRLITLISSLVLKPFGVDLADDDGNVTEEDIMSMVNEGHEQGVLEADETEMITNIFELGDKEAADIMTHRTNMTALDGSMSLKKAVDFILNEGVNTRYPVYGEDIDDIIGILHMRDAMAFAEKEENRDRMIKDIPGLLREANFIPETRNIDTLFKEMQSRKIHMEIVVDEYGQTAGIVAMEDILEEIVLMELYRELMRRGDLIKQRESLEQFQKVELSRLNKELGNYRTQYRSLQTEKDTLYENYAVKQIEAGEYRSRADGIALQMQELSRKIEETELAFSRLTEEYNQPKQDMKEIIRFSQMEKLTQEAVDVFIKKVIIYRDKRVEIEWNYAFGEE